MTKQDIIEQLSLHNRLGSKAAATEVLDYIIELTTTALSKGEEVYLGQSFGGFKVAVQAPRSGTNSLTGKPFSTPEKRVPKFKPSAALKATIAG